MPLTGGLHHIALITSDLDRLIDFYSAVFDARVIADMQEGDLRHALLDLGGGFALHPFFVGDNPHATGPGRAFERGHVDHFALRVEDRDTFELLRRRLVERRASDGLATDFGMVRTVGFVDPDGWEGEIAHWQDGAVLPFDDRVQEPYLAPTPG